MNNPITSGTDSHPAWWRNVLVFAAIYNLLAGFSMMVLYSEGFYALGLQKTSFNLPIQLVGMCVALFGIGYWIVSRNPVENRNVLLLGMLSKLIGPLLAVRYIMRGDLPAWILIVFFFADWIYLLPFWLIYSRCRKQARKII
jgi:CDP-diglyceride synthetase